MTLAETQALFHAAITGAEPVERRRLESCFVGTPELPAGERVAIYADMYLWRLIDGLRQTFPNLGRYLGDERFAALGEAYLRRHPSEHHDIAQVGRHLASFLREHPAEERPDLADLAELEWARQEVFFAPSAEPLVPGALAALRPEELARVGLALTPALRLLQLEHAAIPIWHSLEEGAPPGAPSRERSIAAVWRVGFDVAHGTIAPEERAALEAARAGASLAEICAAFAGQADPAAAAFEALSSWLAEGWIVGLPPPRRSRAR